MATREGVAADDGDLFASPPDFENDYVTVDGVRLVRPYAFDFVCHVKRRQAGLDVVEAFAREFPGRPRSYYEAAHGIGLLRVERLAPARNKPPGKKKGSVVPDKARNKRRHPGDDEEAHHEEEEEAVSVIGPISSTPPASFPKNENRSGGSNARETTKKISPLRPLCAGERVRHFLHRHEPPTLDDPVTVLAVTDSMVAVHKPATVPVHPTGQYRKNTVLGLLAAARPDLGRLLPVHRLDKNVSGLLLMARDSASANRLREEVQSHSVRKRYVALVSSANLATGKHILETFSRETSNEGERFLQTGESEENAPATLDDALEKREKKNRVVVDVALRYDPRARVASPCVGSTTRTHDADPRHTPHDGTDAKNARTAFALVAVSAADARVDSFRKSPSFESEDAASADDANPRRPTRKTRKVPLSSPSIPRGTALVACAPLTGRTHQIRAHLKHLGHPIANDFRYGGAAERDGEKTKAMLATCRATRANALSVKKKNPPVFPAAETNAPESEWPLCPHCPMMAHGANDAAEGDAGGSGARAEDLERLYLHCAEYRGDAWAFACPMPSWVPEDVADEAATRCLDDA
jgi:23S rRNA-/tRNA-specific pseudouridylate synthase